MPDLRPPMKDAYTLILEAIDAGVYKPGDRLASLRDHDLLAGSYAFDKPR